MKLVIIEGSGKKDTIKKYLGSGYDVQATGGHFRDLQKRALSVDVDDNYKPKYVIANDKKEAIKKLKEKAENAEMVILATDPDREGEAIAWHLAYALGIKADKVNRIVFNEITRTAVKQALESPRGIDVALVNAQQARRILDRLVGYKLSPIVSKKIKPKLSAGRVQSVTLKMVVVREREILDFKPQEYWDFGARLEKSKVDFLAALKKGKDGENIKLVNQGQVEAVVADLNGAEYFVKEVKRSITKRHAPAPYMTSSMQQDALNKAGMSLKRCSMAAQDLYQGVKMGEHGMVALVTYIRTDSVRVSPEAQRQCKEYVVGKFGAEYAPEGFNFYKSKKSAQDAHEAIRPTRIDITPEQAAPYLSPDQAKLYRLIYNRFLASQMAEATFNSVAVDIGAAGYMFRVNGKTPIFAGWLAAYGEFGGAKKKKDDDDDSEKDEDDNQELPELKEGDKLKFIKLEYAQKFTKPPARFTEATLVKAMEERGIGRPATYNPTIQNITTRLYIEKDGKYVKPTELGFKLVDFLVKYFPDVMSVTFTAGMEEKLDDIAYEGLDWVKVVDDFYRPFEKELDKAMDGDDVAFKVVLEETEIPCHKCGKMMVVRVGRFGKFIACPGFPACRNILPMDKPVCKCPYCTAGEIYKRKSKKGRFFYGCNCYPNCDFVAWDEPTGQVCEKCGKPIVKGKDGVVCGNKECK